MAEAKPMWLEDEWLTPEQAKLWTLGEDRHRNIFFWRGRIRLAVLEATAAVPRPLRARIARAIVEVVDESMKEVGNGD